MNRLSSTLLPHLRTIVVVVSLSILPIKTILAETSSSDTNKMLMQSIGAGQMGASTDTTDSNSETAAKPDVTSPAATTDADANATPAASTKVEIPTPTPIIVQVTTPPPPPAPPAPKPVTIDNVNIPVDELSLILKPLSTDELKIEVEAWFEKLHAKSKEIAEQELATSQLNKKQALIDEQLKSLEAITKPDTSAAPDSKAPSKEERLKQAQALLSTLNTSAGTSGDASATNLTDTLKKESEGLSKKKEELTEATANLRDQRTAIADRMNAVFDAINVTAGLKPDGTDNEIVTPYRLYVNSITGLNIDLSDTESTKKGIQKWLLSEEGGLRWLKNIGLFFAIIFGFWILSFILSFLVSRAMKTMRNPSRLLGNFMTGLVKKVTMIIGFIMALSALEVNISPLLAALGAIGFILAFALQGTISNFASGLLILLYRPFDVGDSISAAGISGTVQSMTLVSTHITTPDNQNMIVPNNAIWGGTITNATSSKNRRVDLTFTIPKGDDVAKAQAVLEDIVAKNPKVLRDPAPLVRVNAIVDGNAQFVVRPWVLTADYGDVYWDITRDVKLRLDRENIALVSDTEKTA